jgi:crotonobetainyl-CoA:carnitine CoA-transferase CaiB-like acyl-CoA transferase
LDQGLHLGDRIARRNGFDTRPGATYARFVLRSSVSSHDTEAGDGPLHGVVVLAVTNLVAGAHATAILGDMGADVIRVERPGGRTDPGAGSEREPLDGVNRNKRSLVLDLSCADGAEAFRRLADRADVVVENLRPGAMRKLGLGDAELRARNPRLVTCSISGFGATGPYRDRSGFDLVAQAMSGVLSFTGTDRGELAKLGVPAADLNAGVNAALGVVLALLERTSSGRGQHVDVSLLDSLLAYTPAESADWFDRGVVAGPLGTAHRLAAPYEVFRTADGWVAIGAATDATWRALCTALEREDLLADERWRTGAGRLAGRVQLARELADQLATRPTADWLAALDAARVPCGPLLRIDEALADPHVLAREMVVEPPDAPGRRVLGIPIKLSRTPGSVRRRAPRHGEHTAEVLARFGVGMGASA